MPNSERLVTGHERDIQSIERRHVVFGLATGIAAGALGLAFPRGALSNAAGGAPGGQAVGQASNEFHVVQHSEASPIWFLGTLALIKGNGGATGSHFGTVEFLHPAEFETPLHVHNNEDEAFYVLEGSIAGICDGEEWTASQGDFVWLPKGSQHGYRVMGEATVRTLAFSLPAGFEQFVIEAGEPALTREIPPPSAPDFEKLGAAAAKYGQEILGPLPPSSGA